ncbi:bifunctional DNA primase/polymerase [Streptomyces sp. H27-D2]|uniref:bifunctional DNA primase/polymerase n=1 Tax=Streptomyces sp. H27-D2 TaxID=3046304 RepID=UPI002DBAF609|nr:bifunctional DNA primase/polymerase [Streptomyces sp. H27-D2]MEC4016131.1 bifunctional DNA primase/polymerase [Streptomyces sp. H27-D2]
MPTTEAARTWLAKADPDREHARTWFANAGVALLPVGRIWDAVRIDGQLATRILQAGIDGPVIQDHGSYYYLVPLGTATTWTVAGTACLGDSCYIAVPTPSRISGQAVHWMQPPDGSGALVDPARLAELTDTYRAEVGPC